MKTYVINIKTREDRRHLMDLMLRENGFEIYTDDEGNDKSHRCLLYTSPSPRDRG